MLSNLWHFYNSDHLSAFKFLTATTFFSQLNLFLKLCLHENKVINTSETQDIIKSNAVMANPCKAT